MLSYLKIIIRNITTPIFLIITCLAVVLLFLGEKQDALFMVGVVSINVLVGIIQEFRARYKLHQLELLTAPKAKLLLDGAVQEVDYQKLSIGDRILVELGDELPADGKIVKNNGLECDESMLTGESVAIKKKIGDLLYASSIVVAGSAEVLVEAVGDQTRVGAMSAKLKNYDPQLTPLQQSISRAVKYFTILAIVLGALFLVVYWQRDFPLVQIVKTITTAAITVVPEGLLLASTVFLAYGSLRLTQVRVLPQKLSAIEGMALLDVLCIDKTGTLTSPEITFHDLIPVGDHFSRRKLGRLLGVLARETGPQNSTSLAIADAFSPPLNYSIIDSLAFSSDRKMSGVRVRLLTNSYSIIMGAPEYIEQIAPLSKQYQKKIEHLATQGFRVLLVAELPSDLSFDQLDGVTGQVVGIIVLNNKLREGVSETIKFLQDNQISIRVISGDSPETVAQIAKLAGVKSTHKRITGAELAKLKTGSREWDAVVAETVIFARILPEQKEKIISSFQKQGMYTGMVGDGVNDALALKTADLGVAMGAGATASRRVSDLVLLDNSFASLPAGMKLGSQIMLSIEMVACLAFHKIFFGVGLSILTLIFRLPYPFLPRHMTFMNIFLMTLPTLLITVFTPESTVKINPKNFWRDTLGRTLPIAGLSAVGIFLSYAAMLVFADFGVNVQGQSTLAVLVATFFGVYMIYLTNLMFRTKQTRYSKIASIIYVVWSSIIALIAFGWSFARNFFEFYAPSAFGALVAVAIVALIALAQLRVAMDRRSIESC